MSFEPYHEHPKFKEILDSFPASLQVQFSLANIIIRAHKTFIDYNLLTMTRQQERAFDSIVRMVLTQIDAVDSTVTSGKWSLPV
jgi:hypothetical protein